MEQKKLIFYASVISGAVLVTTSMTPSGTFVASSMGYSSDYISSYALPGDILVSDEDGYLVKINPQTNDSNRIGLTDFAVHTVESGETLSLIAASCAGSRSTGQPSAGCANLSGPESGSSESITDGRPKSRHIPSSLWPFVDR